jgi:predicted phosphate transport protein (TIGR00153 family)
MRLALMPRSTQFYGLFTEAGRNVLEAARLAEQRFQEFPNPTVSAQKVKDLEHEGDRLTAEIYRLLNTQYVTPFDRDDVANLAKAIDDVVDHIEHASDLLDLYKVQSSMDHARRQCRVLVGAAEHLARALAALRGFAGISEHLAAVKRQEDEGDGIVRDAIAGLFDDEAISALEVIRWKDIFEVLEDAVDACDTAAHLVGNIVVKNA